MKKIRQEEKEKSKRTTPSTPPTDSFYAEGGAKRIYIRDKEKTPKEGAQSDVGGLRFNEI